MNEYLFLVESPEGNRSQELVHLFHSGGLKLAKFVSIVVNWASQNDVTPQSTEPKVFASFKEESLNLLGLKWDHNNDTQIACCGTSTTVTKSLTMFGTELCVNVFDLIGLIEPFTVGARLLLKDIWRVSGQH